MDTCCDHFSQWTGNSMGHCSFSLYLRMKIRLLVKALLIATLRGETGFGDLMSGPGQCSRHQPLMLEVVDSEDVGDDHDHHGDVESEEGAEDEKVLVVHLAHAGLRHGYQTSHMFFGCIFLTFGMMFSMSRRARTGMGEARSRPSPQVRTTCVKKDYFAK